MHFQSILRGPVAALLLAACLAAAQASPLEDASAAAARGDYAAALALLKPLAEAGNVDALGNLGNMYAFGQGVPVDLRMAHGYWTRAADKHLGTAMYNIATLYFAGKPGFEKDELVASQWYKRAAEHRHPQAMLTVSSMYAMGRALPQDRRLAVAWASLCESNAGNPQLKQAAQQQLLQLVEGLPREEIGEIQNLVNGIAKTIDANLTLYRSQ